MALKPLRIFIGFDERETVAANVLAHSLQRRSSVPLAISYVMRSQLSWFKRQRGPLDSTDFSITRFLVPYLAGGVNEPVLFLDCDMLCLADIAELVEQHWQPELPVCVVKHDYTPRGETKFLGEKQTAYTKKNWTSLMAFNPALAVHELQPHYVEQAPGLELHQFKWLPNDSYVGALPKGWNYLVGEDNQCPIDEVRIAHFTRGGPYFKDYDSCEFSRAWFAERDDMLKVIEKVSQR